MEWEKFRTRVRKEIQPGHRGILKCRGEERRQVVRNDGAFVQMVTGKDTDNKKKIRYEMIEYAFRRVTEAGSFDSDQFHQAFKADRCMYSMTGGVLLEFGVAERVEKGNKSCIYRGLRRRA